LSELETQFIIAGNLKYCDNTEILEEIIDIRKKMLSLIKSLKGETVKSEQGV